eukprot:CAMPEP_0201735888 /NCGR_PEP_ID=MMETSP0593-20130828/38253_1 /ASSEMBLY_ACC=CAM_ASM_000672 /TAXON_ID=267983 /ORGANISM="Skeletonema japonicum, Strain CCMP2506" /LENGTH=45 /DNA_ID= /DNA_START= /DNA_END= /DNA_ORIENTATION=
MTASASSVSPQVVVTWTTVLSSLPYVDTKDGSIICLPFGEEGDPE